MPEYKPPPLVDAEGQGGASGKLAKARAARPSYTGPKWLEFVPAHSPTVLVVILHLVALGISIIPGLAGVGPFWSFVMALGSVLVVAREYRSASEPNPFTDWMPQSIYPPAVPAVYAALAVGLSLPMLQFSPQPLLWVGGTVLVVHHQWDKVLAGEGGLAAIFEPRSLVRGHRVMALAGVTICLLALFFTWTAEIEPTSTLYLTAQERVRTLSMQRPAGDSVYGGTGAIRLSGIDLPVGSTVELGLLGILVLLMLRREVDRPEWLRFVPAGITVIALAWVLVNRGMKVGPIMFLVGLIPVGLIAVLQAIGRDDLDPEPEEAPVEEPPLEEPYPEYAGPSAEDDFPAGPAGEEDMRG
jgi:hypothetical protein